MDLNELRRELEMGEYEKRIREEFRREFRFERLCLIVLLAAAAFHCGVDF